jgi:hypothetical protein
MHAGSKFKNDRDGGRILRITVVMQMKFAYTEHRILDRKSTTRLAVSRIASPHLSGRR